MPNINDKKEEETPSINSTDTDIDIMENADTDITTNNEDMSTVQDIDFTSESGGHDYSALIYDFLVTQRKDGPTTTIVETQDLKMAVKHEITSGDMLVTLAMTVVAVLQLLRMVYKR